MVDRRTLHTSTTPLLLFFSFIPDFYQCSVTIFVYIKNEILLKPIVLKPCLFVYGCAQEVQRVCLRSWVPGNPKLLGLVSSALTHWAISLAQSFCFLILWFYCMNGFSINGYFYDTALNSCIYTYTHIHAWVYTYYGNKNLVVILKKVR